MSTISKSLVSDLQGDIQAYEDADKALTESKERVVNAEEALEAADKRIAERIAREVFDIGVGDIVRFEESATEWSKATSVTLKVTRIYSAFRWVHGSNESPSARLVYPHIQGLLVRKDGTVGTSDKRVFTNKDTKVTKIASR